MNAANKPVLPFGWLRALVYVILSLLLAGGLSLFAANYVPASQGPGDTAVALLDFMLAYLALALMLVTLALLMRRFLDRQSIGSMGFQWTGFGGHAAAGFFLGILILSLGSLVLVMLQYLFFTGAGFNARELLYSLLLFVTVALAEEIAFRGYILRNLMDSMNKWAALLISALLFSLFHASNDNVGMLALLNIFVAGVLLGINYLFTKNLWFAVFLHFSWNFFQGPVFGYEVSGIPLNAVFKQTIKGPDLLTGGDFGFEGSLICLVLNTLTCFFLAAYYSGYRSDTRMASGRGIPVAGPQ